MDPVVSVQNKNFSGNTKKLAKVLGALKGSLGSFTLTIPWKLAKACEDHSWNHCTSTPHISETNGISERAVRRVKEGTSAVLLQSGLDEKFWQIPWNAFPICDTFKIFCLMGEHLTNRDSANHLKDQSFRLVHWLSITLSLRKTSQESINLERKSYLDCSLDTLCTREDFGRVTCWLQTLRSWRRWTHQKSTL